MNIKSGTAKLVLLCPAWKKYGTARTVKPGTVILHSRADDVIPFRGRSGRKVDRLKLFLSLFRRELEDYFCDMGSNPPQKPQPTFAAF
jgi:hypothetical protein